MRISVSGSVRFRLEQISAVTDLFPEQWRPDLTIIGAGKRASVGHSDDRALTFWKAVCVIVW